MEAIYPVAPDYSEGRPQEPPCLSRKTKSVATGFSRLLVAEPLRDLMTRPSGQIHSLDALRSLAILLVLLGHVCGHYLDVFHLGNRWTTSLTNQGAKGVDLFFVLSGYFIGRQLWRELSKTGTIQFRVFVLRRGFRIWPLYMFFLVAVLIFRNPGGLASGRGWSDALFVTNYFTRQGVVLGSRSLCVEEQFYTLTPLLLILSMAMIGSIRDYRKYLVFLLLLEPVVRAISWWCLTGSLTHRDPDLYVATLYQNFHTHADGLIMGLLLANLEIADGDRFKSGFLSSGWCVFAACAAGMALYLYNGQIFGFTQAALLFGSVVWYLLSNRPWWLSWLDLLPFYWISRLSFGMYLNHPYIMKSLIHSSLWHEGLAARFPALHATLMIGLVAVVSVAAALLTYCLVEYPFLHLRRLALDRNKGLMKPRPS